MQSPFLFGKTVSVNCFTNRTQDIIRLKANFLNKINSIIKKHVWLMYKYG